MVTTKFYLDTRRAKEGTSSLLKVSITQHRKVAYITLDVRLKSNQWNADKEKIVNHPDGFMLNTFIQEKKRKIDSAIITLDQNGNLREMTAMEIKERVMALLNPAEEVSPSQPESLFLTRFQTFVEPKKESTRITIVLFAFDLAMREFLYNFVLPKNVEIYNS